jgi:hypothetical protein
VNIADIKTGVNNEVWQEVGVKLEMVGAMTTKFTYYDTKNPSRFSIPDDIVGTPSEDGTKSSEAMGWTTATAANGNLTYTLKDNRDPKNNWYLTNDKMASHFFDKYIQIDLSLSS